MTRETILAAYERYEADATPGVERLFHIVLGISLCGFVALGFFLRTMPSAATDIAERITAVRAQFVMPEEKRPEAPRKAAPKPAARAEPVDLTNNPLLNQKQDRIAPPSAAPRVRAVYGLKRVYSYGIGAGGSLADAVIGKLGNTINKDVDTFTVTKEEIKGRIVSTTTVTAAPKFKKSVKPVITPEMEANKVEGVIKVRVLVDIDGRVKKAVVMNDLGFGTREAALAACLQMEFEPAYRGAEPVAVWIVIPIRFVLLGSDE
jgi:TonB family protein